MSQSPSSGRGPSIPSWIYELREIARLGPVTWFRQRAVNFVLGAVGALLFQAVDVIQLLQSIVEDGVTAAGEPLVVAITAAGSGVVGLVTWFSTPIAGFASLFGPAAPLVVFGSWTAVLVLAWRVGEAALPAITDALGAIPVVGSLLDSVSTFVINFVGGGD